MTSRVARRVFIRKLSPFFSTTRRFHLQVFMFSSFIQVSVPFSDSPNMVNVVLSDWRRRNHVRIAQRVLTSLIDWQTRRALFVFEKVFFRKFHEFRQTSQILLFSWRRFQEALNILNNLQKIRVEKCNRVPLRLTNGAFVMKSFLW